MGVSRRQMLGHQCELSQSVRAVRQKFVVATCFFSFTSLLSSGKPRAKVVQGQSIGKEQAEKSKGLFSADDWSCSKCGNVNWARRNQCNMCNAPKHVELEVRTGMNFLCFWRLECSFHLQAMAAAIWIVSRSSTDREKSSAAKSDLTTLAE